MKNPPYDPKSVDVEDQRPDAKTQEFIERYRRAAYLNAVEKNTGYQLPWHPPSDTQFPPIQRMQPSYWQTAVPDTTLPDTPGITLPPQRGHLQEAPLSVKDYLGMLYAKITGNIFNGH